MADGLCYCSAWGGVRRQQLAPAPDAGVGTPAMRDAAWWIFRSADAGERAGRRIMLDQQDRITRQIRELGLALETTE